MATELLRALPGFTFETVTAPLDDALPRMDVAVFAGFAASGPIGVPVAVEDAAAFADIFGADVRLAWDRQRGEAHLAHLGPAVRAFFRNGGRRAWIVRVADRPVANTFVLPGLVSWAPDRGTVQAVRAQARSEGSWSDGIEAATSVRRDGLLVDGVAASGAALTLTLHARADLEPHDLIEVAFAAQGVRAFGAVETLGVDGDWTQVRLFPVVWFTEPPGTATFAGTTPPAAAFPGLPVLPAPSRVQRLRLDLVTRQASGDPRRIENLGLAAGHSRFWADLLPTDAAFFAPWADPMAVAFADARPAITGRFALAALDPDDIVVPIAESVTLDYQGPEPLAAAASIRDGLARFDRSLFLDPRLRDASVSALPGLAESIAYHGSPQTQPLSGIHATYFIDEPTLLAIPDAVHAGWDFVDETEPAAGVELPAEEAPADPCHTGSAFDACEPCRLPAPALHAIDKPDASGTIRLAWDAVPDALGYLVEEADAPDYDDWQEIASVTLTAFDVYDRPPGTYAFRVRAVGATRRSPGSAGQTVTIKSGVSTVVSAAPYDRRGLLDLQRSMLRMCAARADMVAVLALPETDREADALAHVRDLTAGPIEPALSYGTLYHPWLVTAEETGGAVRRTPPDGAACGLIARRALARGAWVAPANDTLRGVVSLTPALRTDARSRRELLTAQLNVITHEPAGFMTLNADTLSDTPDLRLLNVRRLLILIRRRALQVGAAYVFEPNGPAFARQVQRGFEDMLGYLYERGAFSGPTAQSSYRVVVHDGLNPQASRDLGRFFVELYVAPSKPLVYLRVRLMQRGDRLSATEGQ